MNPANAELDILVLLTCLLQIPLADILVTYPSNVARVLRRHVRGQMASIHMPSGISLLPVL